MMADLGIAEIRAEGRRLLAAAGRGGHSELTDLEVFMVDNAVVLLADPGPVGLTEDEQVTVDWLRDSGDPWDRRVLAMTDRLTGSRAVTVPVPLTDIERERQDREGLTVEPLPPLYHCYVDPDAVLTVWRAYFDNRLRAQSRYVLEQQHLDVVAERDTLREALRIAVEGLDRVERWYVCKNVPDDDGDFITCRGFTDDSTGWCGWCCALDAIESVRELVDLGGDDG